MKQGLEPIDVVVASLLPGFDPEKMRKLRSLRSPFASWKMRSSRVIPSVERTSPLTFRGATGSSSRSAAPRGVPGLSADGSCTIC